MKNIIITTILCVSLLFNSGCSGFLKENSQNLAYVETIEDLEELLIGGAYLSRISGAQIRDYGKETTFDLGKIIQTKQYFPFIHIMDDDLTEYFEGVYVENQHKSLIRARGYGVHHWQGDPFFDLENMEWTEEFWTTSYGRIAVINSIIDQLEEMDTSSDPKLAKKVEGEARFLRAQNYFFMTNLYGLPYSKLTADQDFGIPLKITSQVLDIYFTRDSQKKVYEQIEIDLKRAIECLDGIDATPYRANQAGAQLLLSRVYLYMERYEEAIEMADHVIEKGDYNYIDLNNHSETLSFTYKESPETIFSQGLNTMNQVAPSFIDNTNNGQGYQASMDLLNSYADDDLRRIYFFSVKSLIGERRGYCKLRSQDHIPVSDYLMLRYSEATLNKAEALALLRRDQQAIDALTPLLNNRFEVAPIVNKAGNDLIDYIREERRRELCFEGHRWFDLRRYAVNSVHPFQKELVHAYLKSDEGVVYTAGYSRLKRYDEDKAAYVWPIPVQVIDFHQGNLTNLNRSPRSIDLSGGN